MHLHNSPCNRGLTSRPNAYRKNPNHKENHQHPTTKTTTHSVTGTVKEYNQGKSIVVTTAQKKDVTFDLGGDNLTATVAPEVAVGNNVKVVEKTNNSGHKTVTVTRTIPKKSS